MLQAGSLTSNRTVFVLLFLLLALLLVNLGSWGVIETSEARYAEISREMMLSGDWLHPRLLGIQHFHKPPVTYIISALGMKIFGSDAFGARFFLQVSLVLQALLVYLIGRNLFGEKRPAIIALAVYISIPAVLVSARNLTTDSFLTTFELAAIWGWLQYRREFRVSWLYFFYFLLALAFLTKGPVGLFFPMLVCLTYRAGIKQRARKGKHIFLTILLCVVLSASWYVYLMIQDKQFVSYFLLKHTVQRVANAETFGRSKPWWFYLVLVPVLSLPWSAILVAKYQKIKQLSGKNVRLFLIWIFVPLIFFSVSSSKLILYVLPLFAGMALFTGYLLHNCACNELKKTTTFILLFYSVLAVAFLLIPFLPFKISLPAWTMIFPVIILSGLISVWRETVPEHKKIVSAALLFTFILIPFSTFFLAENPELTKSGKSMADFIKAENLQNQTVIIYDQLLPSLAFHLKKDIISVYENDKNLIRETQFETDENWRKNYLNMHSPEDETYLRSLLEKKPVLVVKGEIQQGKDWLTKSFLKKKQFGSWNLYY